MTYFSWQSGAERFGSVRYVAESGLESNRVDRFASAGGRTSGLGTTWK